MAKKVIKHEHEGHRLRLKSRFFKEGGFENFEEHNILEFILFYTIPRGDTNERAHRILNHFGSLSAVIDAPYSELIKVDGITPNTACLLKTILPAARAYNYSKYKDREILIDESRISDYISGRYVGLTEEVFSITSLDNCFRVISFDIVSKGGLNSVNADVRSSLEILINNKASKAILAHNHPNGYGAPSINDITSTREIIDACKRIDVKIIDHVLVADGRCVSMRSMSNCAILFE